MIVNRNSQHPLGLILTYNITIKNLLDLGGLEDILLEVNDTVLLPLLLHDVVAEVNALVADVHRGPRDDFLDFILGLAAKGAAQGGVLGLAHRGLQWCR